MLYSWTDGHDVTYTNWAYYEPNNSGNEDCVEMYVNDVSWLYLREKGIKTVILTLYRSFPGDHCKTKWFNKLYEILNKQIALQLCIYIEILLFYQFLSMLLKAHRYYYLLFYFVKSLFSFHDRFNGSNLKQSTDREKQNFNKLLLLLLFLHKTKNKITIVVLTFDVWKMLEFLLTQCKD